MKERAESLSLVRRISATEDIASSDLGYVVERPRLQKPDWQRSFQPSFFRLRPTIFFTGGTKDAYPVVLFCGI